MTAGDLALALVAVRVSIGFDEEVRRRMNARTARREEARDDRR